MDHIAQTFTIDNLELQCGVMLPTARLVYRTYGELNAAKDNVVVLPTFYTGTHIRNEGFFGQGRAIDRTGISLSRSTCSVTVIPPRQAIPRHPMTAPASLPSRCMTMFMLKTDCLRNCSIYSKSRW